MLERPFAFLESFKADLMPLNLPSGGFIEVVELTITTTSALYHPEPQRARLPLRIEPHLLPGLIEELQRAHALLSARPASSGSTPRPN